jgi:ABC-type sugar transport system permease subunit
MTDGGPSNSTELLATYMFRQGFTNYRLGYASAVAVVMFLITLLLTIVVLIRSNRRETKG